MPNAEDAKSDDVGLPQLEFDPADYKDEVQALQLTEQEAEKFLHAMWNLMRMIVEMNLSLKNFPMISEELAEYSGEGLRDWLKTNSGKFNCAVQLGKGNSNEK